MGYSEDIMNDMAMKDLTTMFAVSDGWQRKQISGRTGSEIVYSFSRRNQGKAENGVAWVSFSPDINPDVSAGFSDIAEKIPNCTRKVLLVPRSAVVPALAPEIEVKEMKAFGLEDGRLVWLTKRKNAMSYPRAQGN
jgi:hypothetical protein